LPNVLEIYSYTFFCCGASIGVFISYQDFIKFIKMEERYSSIPNPLPRSLLLLLGACTAIPIYRALKATFPLQFCLSEEFASWHWPTQAIWTYCFFKSFQYFYYTAFFLQEGSIVASGLGYNGLGANEQARWDTIMSCDFVVTETGSNMTKCMSGWNHQVHLWLKHQVQTRLQPIDERPTVTSNLITFMTSALWHGIYPAYFLTFFYIFAIMEFTKDVYKGGAFM
jgi:hypothetical protein